MNKDTQPLPILWRGKLVKVAHVDTILHSLLSLRQWHPSQLKRLSTPRTSIVVSPARTLHLALSRTVVVLSKLSPADRLSLWTDPVSLLQYTKRVPAIGFFDNNPFNCVIDNIKLANQPVSINNIDIDFKAPLDIPLSALHPSSGLEPSVSIPTAVVEDIKETLMLAPPAVLDEIDSSDHDMIKGLQDLLGE